MKQIMGYCIMQFHLFHKFGLDYDYEDTIITTHKPRKIENSYSFAIFKVN
jgi:hypothetical protein